MARYGNFNIKKKKRLSAPLLASAYIIAAALLIVFIVGIAAGPDREESARMSVAVRENTELKQRIDEMNGEIEELKAQINDLQSQLAAARAAQTEAEESAALPSPSAQSDLQSPREGFR